MNERMRHVVKEFQHWRVSEQVRHLREDHGIAEASEARETGWAPAFMTRYALHVEAHYEGEEEEYDY